MLLGAAAGFRAAYQADSIALGLATAMGAGALLALVHGLVTVRMVAARYSFYPQMVEVPVDTRVTFRITSPDIVHGVHVPFTNMSTMVIPGYISEVTTKFSREGEAQFLCNEYCGLGHDYMWSKLKVVPKG